MAVEKMKLVNIIGPVDDFERVVLNYLVGKEIHIENIFDVFGNKNIKPFDTGNEYSDILRLAGQTLSALGIDESKIPRENFGVSANEAKEYFETLNGEVSRISERIKELEDDVFKSNALKKQIEHIADVDIPLCEMFSFKNIKIRLGKMPAEAYKKIEYYLKDYDVYFIKFSEDRGFVYGAYFTPKVMKEKIDSIFSSLYFNETRIDASLQDTPKNEVENLNRKILECQKEISDKKSEMTKIKHSEYEKICRIYGCIKCRYEANEVRKLAGYSDHKFKIAGWISEKYLDEYQDLFKNEEDITLVIENPDIVPSLKPPTKLKNFFLFRPFESFIEMYGLPSYNEIDPTALFAITYMLMFGIMYGDVGHGFVLGLVGIILAGKKNFLGPILVNCGVSSMIFGAVFSSIFGYEGKFWHPLWEPMHNMMPTLIITVALGTVIISLAMVFNIANGIKQKSIEKIFFDPNGIAGFVFYWAVIITVLGALSILPVKISTTLVVLFIVVPFLLMFLKEPLGKLFEGNKDWMPKNKGEYVLETVFESIELLLSYATNTVSFIRVGAFALNHAGMMSVVFTLARLSGGSDNIFIVIIGNLVVLALEGLLVAIQVLRLQFYEMFSRYYEGNGRPFKKIGGR